MLSLAVRAGFATAFADPMVLEQGFHPSQKGLYRCSMRPVCRGCAPAVQGLTPVTVSPLLREHVAFLRAQSSEMCRGGLGPHLETQLVRLHPRG